MLRPTLTFRKHYTPSTPRCRVSTSRRCSQARCLDLPTVEKDLLILMAANYGNIDRYPRLRRPAHVEGELNCVARGAHHDTMFALWCARQPDPAGEQPVPYEVL